MYGDNRFKCRFCGEGFDRADERDFHETLERHCPTCKEQMPDKGYIECRLCMIEKLDVRENDSVLWH
jgi:hypothetical protein